MITKAPAKRQAVPDTEKLVAKYGCGPVHFSGTDEALYERHLLFDSGVDLAARRRAIVSRRLRGQCATFCLSDGS
jgi:hypothetical protein